MKDWEHLEFIIQQKHVLEQLNALRNRVWHRGVFILRYPALDAFIGGYILPFVSAVIKHPAFAGDEILWKYRDLACGVDPIEVIIRDFSTSSYDIGKIAFLKELGRAAFENPIYDSNAGGFTRIFNNREIRRAERIASAVATKASLLRQCSVCGTNALVIYEDIDHDWDPGSDEPTETWIYTYKVKCECCSFELAGDVNNASEYGISSIPDYWTTRGL